MLTFTVRYFADEGTWRVTGHDEQYWAANTIDDIPRCIRGMMRYQADFIEALAKEPVAPKPLT